MIEGTFTLYIATKHIYFLWLFFIPIIMLPDLNCPMSARQMACTFFFSNRILLSNIIK